MTYKTLINDVCTNDAAIEAVAVALTLHNWTTTAVVSTINAGKTTRIWWKTDDAIAPLIRLVGEIVWLVLLLCWQYFTGGKAQAHAEAVVGWVREYGIPGAVQGLDALCCFLLCYEKSMTDKEWSVPDLDFGESDALVAWARSLY